MKRAIEQLARVVGEEQARALLEQAMASAGLTSVTTPQDLLRVSDELAKQGGFPEVVARTLKVHAILAGARVARPSA